MKLDRDGILYSRTTNEGGGRAAKALGRRVTDAAGHPTENSARYSQIGGGHYHNRTIQPYEYAIANNFNYLESNVLKYLTRHRDKNGAEDLRKAIHALELLIEVAYAKTETVD